MIRWQFFVFAVLLFARHVHAMNESLGKEFDPSISKPSGALTYTSYIGTPDHPTIDGGMINDTDNLSGDHDHLKTKQVLSKQNMPFKDDWATSEKVKSFLTAAGKQGKLDYVLKKTDEMGLPASIAVIPMVESNYETQAVSPKGAGGAWQLMPSIAKDYGIKNQDRFQFTISTNTALKLLNKLHQQFGNWELAFAAYNAGTKRVTSAIQKNPNAMTIDELDLPQETKIYIHKLSTLNSIFINTEKNDING